MNKIYLVKALECGMSRDDAFDYIVGYADSLEEAESKCETLRKRNAEDIEFWKEHGSKCLVGSEAWKSPDDPEVVAALEEVQCAGCPYADLKLAEVFYRDENSSGGFEISCKNKTDECCSMSEYVYVIEEVEKL